MSSHSQLCNQVWNPVLPLTSFILSHSDALVCYENAQRNAAKTGKAEALLSLLL